MIVIIIWIAVNTFITGCATTAKTGSAKINNPTIVNKIREGITTKAEVYRLLGKPNDLKIGSDGSETWTYYSVNSNRGAKRAASSASPILVSMIPLPGMRFTGRAAPKAITLAQSKKKINGSVSFNSHGVVVKVTTMTRNHSNIRKEESIHTTGNNISTAATNVKKQTPVYTTTNSRVYHKRNCSELDTSDLIRFPSSQQAHNDGGVPCMHCNPH